MIRMTALVAVVLVVCSAADHGIPAPARFDIGDKAPPWKLTAVDGKSVTLADICDGAKATVVCFTCNECPISVAYEDRFIEFVKRYEQQGVRFVAINANYSEDLDQMRVRAEAKGFNFPYVYDETGNSARAFGARVTPHVFLLDANAKLIYRGSFDDNMQPARVDRRYLAEAADAALNDRPVKTPVTRAYGCAIRARR